MCYSCCFPRGVARRRAGRLREAGQVGLQPVDGLPALRVQARLHPRHAVADARVRLLHGRAGRRRRHPPAGGQRVRVAGAGLRRHVLRPADVRAHRRRGVRCGARRRLPLQVRRLRGGLRPAHPRLRRAPALLRQRLRRVPGGGQRRCERHLLLARPERAEELGAHRRSEPRGWRHAALLRRHRRQLPGLRALDRARVLVRRRLQPRGARRAAGGRARALRVPAGAEGACS